MPTYRYELQQESGDLLVGSIAAQTASGAATAIQRRGGRIIRLVPLQSGQGSTLQKIWALLNTASLCPKHNIDAILAIGTPVAFDANAEERETLGFTSIRI